MLGCCNCFYYNSQRSCCLVCRHIKFTATRSRFADSLAEVPLQEAAVPIPAAYTRHLSYDVSKDSQFNHHVYIDSKPTNKSGVTEVDSLHEKEPDDGPEEEASTATTRSSLLIYLGNSRIYLRVLAVLVMIVSLSLILSAVVIFSKAQNKPGHPLDAIPQPPTGITVSPPLAIHTCIRSTRTFLTHFQNNRRKLLTLRLGTGPPLHCLLRCCCIEPHPQHRSAQCFLHVKQGKPSYHFRQAYCS